MTCILSNSMQIHPRSGEVCQTKMTKRMGRESMMDVRLFGNSLNNFVPGIRSDPLRKVPIRLGAEKRSAGDIGLRSFFQILSQEITGNISVHYHTSTPILSHL